MGVKDNYSRAIAGIKAKFAQLGKALAVGGGAGLAAGGGFLAAAVPTLGDLAKLDSTAKALGITGEAATGLLGVLGRYSDLGENIEGLTQFNQKVKDAFDGVGGEAAKLFDGLSVTAADLINLPLDEKFYRIHEAIRQLPQDAQQFKLSMLGGTDSMKKWIPLLGMSNAELRRQADQFRLSQDQLDKATAANKAYTEASGRIGRAWQLAVVAAAPAIERLANGVTSLLAPLNNFSKGAAVQSAEVEVWWAQAVGGMSEVWGEFRDFLVDGWDSAVFIGRSLWADFTAYLQKLFVDAVAGMKDQLLGVFDLVGKIPGLQTVALGAKAGVGAIAGNPDGVKREIGKANAAAQAALAADADRAKADRAAARAAEQATARQRVADAAARRDALVAAADAAAAPSVARAAAKAAQVAGSARGLFGNVGGLAGQSLGGRGNEMLTQQKKAVDILGDIRGLLQQAKPLVVT
jgi:hypothetical protein